MFLFAFLFFILRYDQRPTPTPYIFTIQLDSKFSSAEVMAIKKATTHWNRATRGRVVFVIGARVVIPPNFKFSYLMSQPGLVWRAAPDDIQLILFEMLAGFRVVGYAPPQSWILLVPDRLTDAESLEMIATHELGHHIGLAHSPGIMAQLPQTNCISNYDLMQFCEVYSCDLGIDTKKICF